MTVAFKNEAAFNKWVADNKLEGRVAPIRRDTPPPKPPIVRREPPPKRSSRFDAIMAWVFVAVVALSAIGLYTCVVVGVTQHYFEAQIEL